MGLAWLESVDLHENPSLDGGYAEFRFG